jgi:hypothetical protein
MNRLLFYLAESLSREYGKILFMVPISTQLYICLPILIEKNSTQAKYSN